MDIKDCEQGKSGDCCWCKNMAYWNLKEENKKLRNIIEGVEKICTEACLVGGDCRTCKCTCINKRILKVIGNWRSNGD